MENGLAEAWGFSQTDISANLGMKEFRRSPNGALSRAGFEEFFDVIADFDGQTGTGFVHTQHDSFEPKCRIEPFRDDLDRS